MVLEELDASLFRVEVPSITQMKAPPRKTQILHRILCSFKTEGLVSNSYFCLGGLGFKSRPGNRPSEEFFPSPSMQTPM